MAVTAQQVLDEIRPFIPQGNVLTDAEMLSIIQLIIDQVGDADENLPEIKCKSLLAIAQVNNARYQVDVVGRRSEEVGDIEVQWFEGTSQNVWPNYINSLKDICPIFGYFGLSSNIGIRITPGEKPKINPCPCPDKLEF